ncbi:Uncharacterised protein [uncultured Clostridium sp.]|uniref:hypothetical protein n=1 Tax=uncultured Clostridium sp. TaxID=59620 RepID=UPI000821F6CC|nr:hypothetical protein [uncultured Clostridium sp.]SCK04754.1 Uncharacterised protein [uncultured Clostridium sp.]
MDAFENYLFEKINNFRVKLLENSHDPEIVFVLNNCLEEFMEILSEYNLNFKIPS